MSYVPLEPLLGKAVSLYQLVLLASRRAIQLANGDPKLVDLSPKTKIATLALEEIRQGKIRCKQSKAK